jgi:mono/diheme cytochrome c family protein
VCRTISITLSLAVLAGAIWWFAAGSPRARLYAPPATPLAIPTDPASLARGRYLAEAVAVCTICHGENLAGKLAFEDDFLGRGYTANLTAGEGGIGGRYTDADWVRALRFGVKPDGHGILFMPSDYYNALTDADLAALIAHLKSLPKVDNTKTALELSLPARLFIDLGIAGPVLRAATIDMNARPWTKPTNPADYLITLGGCTFCHGPDLRGGQGPEPNAPGGPNLRARPWSLETFTAALRGGQSPDGHRINPKYMPWLGYAHMTDEDVALIWNRLK